MDEAAWMCRPDGEVARPFQRRGGHMISSTASEKQFVGIQIYLKSDWSVRKRRRRRRASSKSAMSMEIGSGRGLARRGR